MPLAKHRPDFAELIAIAAVQRQSIHTRQKKTYKSIRRQTIRKETGIQNDNAISEENEDSQRSPKRALVAIARRDDLIDMSDAIRWILDHIIVRCIRVLVVLLTFLNLTYEAQTTRGDNPSFDKGVDISDIIVAVYFIAEGTLKVLAFYAHMDMHKAFDLKIDTVLYVRKLGFVDIILGICSLVFGSNEIGGWIRLARVLMISSFALDETPHLVILVSGITHGLKSILSTCLLLFLVFMVYAAFGLFFFQRNDPYHFGTIALAMWSFFELSTLDNWSQVLYVNMYGCDKFPAYYTVVNSSYSGLTRISRYGSTLMLPICTTPEKRPAISALIFLSFIVICAFILVNLTVAAVTSGINVRLDSIKKEGSDVMAISQLIAGEVSTIRGGNPNLGKMLIADPDMLLMMLKQVWREQDAYARKKMKHKQLSKDEDQDKRSKYKKKSVDVSSLNLHVHPSASTIASTVHPSTRSSSTRSSVSSKTAKIEVRTHSIDSMDDDNATDHQSDERHYMEWRSQSILFRDVLSHYAYQYSIFSLISFSALLELVVLQRGSTHLTILVTNLVLQLLFSLDLYVQIIAVYPNFSLYFRDMWQCFDAVIVVTTWIPVFAWGRGSGVLGLLNIFRILRLLKLLRWIHELNVILHSIASSAVAIFYVYVLIFGLAYHFAVAGVFLFSQNDPQHFRDLGTSFVTLFQIQSLDDWSEIARTNMYGCDYWGYDSGEDYYDEQCVNPQGLGWFAALYFTLYIMMSVMVLLSLFIGIIITSMELLKEGLKEENEVWEKVKVQQKKYNMRDATINNLLEIFDMIDVGKNGKLTLTELKPIFEIITISEASQFSLYMMVDTDNSGQIDFSEFLELLYLVGKAYKAQNSSGKYKSSKLKQKVLTSMTRQSSAKGFAIGLMNKMTGSGSPTTPERSAKFKDVGEEVLTGDDSGNQPYVNEAQPSGGGGDASTQSVKHHNKRKIYPKLSIVADEDEEEVAEDPPPQLDSLSPLSEKQVDSSEQPSQDSVDDQSATKSDEGATKSFFKKQRDQLGQPSQSSIEDISSRSAATPDGETDIATKSFFIKQLNHLELNGPNMTQSDGESKGEESKGHSLSRSGKSTDAAPDGSHPSHELGMSFFRKVSGEVPDDDDFNISGSSAAEDDDEVMTLFKASDGVYKADDEQ